MRLFVAIEAPPAWRAAAAAVQRAFPPEVREHARLVDPRNLHLTLRFIGEVDETAVPAIHAALTDTLPPVDIEVTLKGIGTFGAPARTSVVWLGLGGDIEGLRMLAARSDAGVEHALGIPDEGHRYAPHLTLARVRNRVTPEARRALAASIGTLPAPPPLPHQARQAVLIHSRLSATGPRYEVLGTYPGTP